MSANSEKIIQLINSMEKYAYGTSKNLVYIKEENKYKQNGTENKIERKSGIT